MEAERSGLVSRIVPVGELHDEAMKVADKIANLSQHAVMMIKEAINRGFATTLAEGTRFERGQFYSLFATEDQKEGMAAFIEKRPPVFKNQLSVSEALTRQAFPFHQGGGRRFSDDRLRPPV